MKGILILAHGSKEKSTEITLKEVINNLRDLRCDDIIETAFLQFSNQNLAWGLEKLQAQGAKEIIVIPYFLFSGIHILEDIPKEIAEYKLKNKEVKITMGKTLGSDKRLAEILADRIEEVI